MSERLNGKIAVVTGAASGIGKAVALLFLKEGAKVMAADINEARLAALKKEAEDLGFGASLAVTACNITDEEDCKKVVAACAETFGGMNVLSHNAGIADNFTMVHEMPLDYWNKLISVNLTGSMFMAKAALNQFLSTGTKGTMVMITSNAAFESATGGPAYTASKAGANALMKSIAFEYGRQGIRCNSICPGPVNTNIVESMGNMNEQGAYTHCYTGYNAHQKEWTGIEISSPDQIAPLAVYLASDESSFVNGSSIVIDGGVCLSR